MDGKPPPITAAHPEWRPPPAPTSESLADCQRRVLECWHDRIAPALFDELDPSAGGWTPRSANRTVAVVAHANTIRSLMAHFDEVPNEDVPNLHVPNSVPILYRFERSTRTLLSTKLQSAAGGSHARWLLSPENHASIRTAIQPGGMLTRAVLDAWDVTSKGVLTVADIERGVQAMLSDDVADMGYALLCVAKPVGEGVKIETVTEEELLDVQLVA